MLICDSRRLGPNMPILFFIYESVLTICLAPRHWGNISARWSLSCVLDAYPSKQDKPILPARSGFSAMSPQLNIFFGHILNPFLIKLVRSRHPGYWPHAALLHFNADIKTQKHNLPKIQPSCSNKLAWSVKTGFRGSVERDDLVKTAFLFHLRPLLTI